ncbi:MAG: hypothetical protein DRO11_08805 [Methanobacteriota archaeon]|nr:MAG: hypothetical protein DRO11_08805 [Euryarchaeota archaeon]
MSIKGFIWFMLLMFLGMFLGNFILAYVPQVDDPTLATIISFVITMFPAYYLFVKFGKKRVE